MRASKSIELLTAAAALTLALGCASRSPTTQYPATSPSSPASPEAPPAAVTTALDADPPFSPAEAAPADAGPPAQHRHGDPNAH